ncbi:MAG: hypothetical protein ACR2K3_01780 [Nocardioides sp.]
MTDDDDRDLIARLHAADPAAHLPSADPTRVARLLEDTMSNDVTTRESRDTGTRDRSPLTWIVAAAAVLLIAGVGAVLFRGDHTGSTPVAGPEEASVTQLTTAPPTGRCVMPSVRLLDAQTIAFRGTVQSVTDSAVVLKVSHWYQGGPTALARVSAPSAAIRQLLGAVPFKVGGDYLVSAYQGQVTQCGLSGPYAGQLSGLYDQAFAG